ncbi:MAG: RNA polymerase sigma factor [Polyangiaceae bacterium]|jgi:RNA polymerase sigma-70 factor (ECF subfamily)
MRRLHLVRPDPGESPRLNEALEDREDEDLMLLVRAGSREAMAVLATRHIDRLTSFCTKLTGDPAAAEDIVQEALLRVWTRRADWRPRGRFVALLFVTARNLCRNRARDVRRRARWVGPEPHDEAEPLSTPADVDPMITEERFRDALRALGELPEAMREAVILRFDSELSYDAIGAIVGATESTVRSRVHYGLLKMRTLLGAPEKR